MNEDSAFGPGMMFGINGPGPKKDTEGIPSDKEMEKGIAEIINRVKDAENKKEMVEASIEDFKREGIVFDYDEFRNLCK